MILSSSFQQFLVSNLCEQLARALFSSCNRILDMFPNVHDYTWEVKCVGAFCHENGRTLTSLHTLYTNSTPTIGSFKLALRREKPEGDLGDDGLEHKLALRAFSF